jgi:signal transduction histidine kinase
MEIIALQKGLEFKIDIDDELPERIYVDTDVLTKIVTNLLSNAFKFTSQGWVSLKVDYALTELVITVSDTGIGIPLDKQDTIFESFRQVDGSIRRAYGGTGLGLSIVKQLSHLLKGKIELKSQVDRGSTFIVSLPLETAPEPVKTKETKVNVIEELDNAYSK